jgi:hypothetical protein
MKKLGPCLNCGKRWHIGWMVPNAHGVCSWRCLKTYYFRRAEDAQR